MIIVDDIRKIREFNPAKGLVTSFYLNVDPKRFSSQQFLAVARALLKEKLDSSRGKITEESWHEMEKDFARIEYFLRNELVIRGRTRGLAIVASGKNDFFQVYRLTQPVYSQIIVGPSPFIRPLLSVFDEHRRLMLVVLDHREARFFEVYMGEILEHEGYHSETRGKVKEGGWYGLEERKIARRIENQVFRHYKDVADILLEHFRLRHFEYLFVGVKEEEYPLLVNFLHTYLRKVVRGRLHLNPKDPINTIIAEALRVERVVEEEEDQAILASLQEIMANKGLAAVGLANVLEVVNRGACQTLLVDNTYCQKGFVCPSCGFLSLESRSCAICGENVIPVDNLIERVIAEVLWQNGEVKYIMNTSPGLKEIEHIGAFLRFKI
ncbi:MAG: baeRF10 domain-containing protein [Candidatus Caldatribacteriaceae bacterium]